jgi:hypothetical protein
MLTTTGLLYSLTRRMFNERVGLCAAVIFSVTESALFLGNLATYDAPALCLLAITAWIVVRTATFRWPVYLPAALPVTVAVATKYASALFVPTIVLLSALAPGRPDPHAHAGLTVEAHRFRAFLRGPVRRGRPGPDRRRSLPLCPGRHRHLGRRPGARHDPGWRSAQRVAQFQHVRQPAVPLPAAARALPGRGGRGPIYYLRQHRDTQPNQFTSTYFIGYHTKQGQYLTGNAGYVAAIKAGYFLLVAYDGQVTPGLDDVLASTLRADPDYRLAASIPVSGGAVTYCVWIHQPATMPTRQAARREEMTGRLVPGRSDRQPANRATARTSLNAAGSAGQAGLDRGDQVRVLRAGHRAEPAEHRPVGGDQELLEVPLDVTRLARGVGHRGQLRVHRVPARPVDFDLLEHRERHPVGGGAELLDLTSGARLLAAELVAGEADDREATAGVLLVQPLQPGVLRREPALGCHVDHEQRAARQVAKQGRLARQGVQGNVMHAHIGVPPLSAGPEH